MQGPAGNVHLSLWVGMLARGRETAISLWGCRRERKKGFDGNQQFGFIGGWQQESESGWDSSSKGIADGQ